MSSHFPRRFVSLLLAAALACSLLAMPAAAIDQLEILPRGQIDMNIGDTADLTFSATPGSSPNGDWTIVSYSDRTTPVNDVISFVGGNTGTKVTVRAEKTGMVYARVPYIVDLGGGLPPSTGYLYKTLNVTGSTTSPTVTGVTVSPATKSMTVGETFTPTATVTMSDGSTPPAATWTSSNPAAATVDASTGRVSAAGAGSTTITATAGGKSGSCAVTVTAQASVPATRVTITVDGNKTTLEKGQDVRLRATVTPDNSTDQVVWSSDRPDVATVTGSGIVTAVSKGSAVITAAAGSVKASQTITVTDSSQGGVRLSKTSATMNLLEKIELTADVYGFPSSADTSVRWTAAPEGKVHLDSKPGSNKAVITAIDTGTVLITAYANAGGDPATCLINIADAGHIVAGVQITTQKNQYIDTGATLELTAYVTPDTATNKSLSWSSSDASVATVSSAGVVTGVKPGKAVITVTTADGGHTDTYDVEVSGIVLHKKTLSLYVNKSETLTFDRFGSAKTITPRWTSKNPSIASTSSATVGRVTGNFPGSTTLTAAAGKYEDTCTVTVSEDLADAIDRFIDSGETLPFSELTSDLDRRSRDKAGSYLSYIYNLSVSTGQGVLYYGYVSPEAPGHGVGGTERYYISPGVSQQAIRNITFVPKAGFSGTAVIDYTGTDSKGVTFVGTIRVEVSSTGDVSYSTASDQPVTFSAEDFTAICQSKTGRGLRYVTFEQPSSSRGTLYYDYSSSQYSQKVNSADRYYPNSTPSLSKVTFLPAKGYVGTADVIYRCVDNSGIPYTGSVRITVYSPSGVSGDRVEYAMAVNRPQDLNASDFNDVCQDITHSNLNYIRFDSLPSSSAGVLYYNYTSSSSYGSRVSTSTRYYRSSTPRISNITFVPATGFSGTVTIPFTGSSTSGVTFTSELILRVGDEYGTVNYSTAVNQPLTFQASDFNDACRRINGATLNRLSFSLPSSSEGTLYYNYVSSSNYGSRVSASTNYYRTGTNSISGITFVPASGYNGTVSISFSGYDDGGSRFSGTVSILVGRGGSDRRVTYTAITGGAVRLDAADFNNVCRNVTGSTLNYVRFDLPASRAGTLYYQYDASRKSGTSVSSTTNYYRSGSGRQINDVTFAASSNTGTVSFYYTAWAGNGDSFTGTVEITIHSPTSSRIQYMGSSTPIALRASDFQSACQGALGSDLSYIEFNSLPGSGRLYMGYTSPTRTGGNVTTETRYYANGSPGIDQIIYLAKAEFQGLASISYTAYAVNGSSHTNTLDFTLSNSYCTTSFSDVGSGWDWARPSIEFLRYCGITNGYGNNTYGPGRQISRGEFTLMLCRAFGFSTSGGSSGFPDVPASSVYAGAVATARDLGIVQGENGRFRPTAPITRQSAMTMISRAMTAAGQTPPAASTALLSAYADEAQISAHARSAVASLIQMGAVRGTSDMRVNPTAAISRAEMAVILHRVLAR